MLVAKAFPDYDLPTLKACWPRVRDAHKAHLKKLQVDFEEAYLDAYERGAMPEITRGVPQPCSHRGAEDEFYVEPPLRMPDV